MIEPKVVAPITTQWQLINQHQLACRGVGEELGYRMGKHIISEVFQTVYLDTSFLDITGILDGTDTLDGALKLSGGHMDYFCEFDHMRIGGANIVIIHLG
jgi:hypothetical protein